MPLEDPYIVEALTAAERFATVEPRFRLDEHLLIPQGDNNRVLRGTFDGCPVIAKFFGDGYKSNTPAKLRKARELAFLCQASCTGLVPEIVAEQGYLVLLQMIEGQPLESFMRARRALSAPPEIATAIGAAHRVFSSLHLTPGVLKKIETVCFNSQTLEDRIDRLLGMSSKAASMACFGALEEETVRLVDAALPQLLAGPRVLYKYDNNLGNVLVDDGGHLCGFIDFEQCYIGTPMLYLGAICDCAHALPWGEQAELQVYQKLPWEALAEGYGSSFLAHNETLSLVLISAMLNNWIRVSDVFGRSNKRSWWAPRLSARFSAYMQAFEAVEQS